MKLVASSLANYYETYRQNEWLCLIGFTASEDHLQIRYNLVTNFMPYKTSTTIEDQDQVVFPAFVLHSLVINKFENRQ